MITGHPFERYLIIGVDPGKTCGFATLDGGVFGAGDLTWHEACVELERLMPSQRRTLRHTFVAVERFTFQASSSRMTRQYDALEFIGVARFLSLKYGATFSVNGASEAQRIASPQTLRDLGWWQRGKDHANKAGAQVAYTASQVNPVGFMTLLPSSTVS